MTGEGKTREQLIDEVQVLLLRVAELERSEAEHQRIEKELQQVARFPELALVPDTAEVKKAEERRLTVERLATLGQFSGDISHELRNPLSVIASSAYYLKTRLKDSDEKVREHLDRIQSSVDKATGVIQSLLDLTQMKKSQLTRLDLVAFISEAITMAAVPVRVKVVRNFPQSAVLVNADREQLGMVFRNIIANAVEAMAGRGTLTVAIGTKDGQAEASFTDTGPGILAENMDKIFQPFFSTKSKGIGFGLPIARLVVERHGGIIEVMSAPGRGATFTIHLPLGADKVDGV